MNATASTLRLGQNGGTTKASPPTRLRGILCGARFPLPRKTYSVTALSTSTDTPGPIVELSETFFM